MIATTAPVLVVSRGYGALAIARTLGRLGVPLYLVAEQGMSSAAWSSRYWAKRMRWDFSRPEHESVEFLVDAGIALESHHGARPLLLTPSDWVAIFLERNRDLLKGQFVFPRPTRPIIHELADKWKMHLLAAEHRIPTPFTLRPASRADVGDFVDAAGLPLIMKAADPYVTDPPSKRLISTRQELMQEVDREEARGPLNVVLQEYIPGGADSVWMCNGYFGRRPDEIAIFTGKKLRQVSPIGIASLAVCLPNDTVARQTRDLMGGIGYRGCAGIGFRYDSRDGRYKLLDVNARISGVFRLFAGTNEMDVVRMCYLDLTDQHVPQSTLRAGRKWMHEEDALAAVLAIRNGALTVRGWVRSIRGVQESQIFAPDDPIPLLMWLREGVSHEALARLRRIAGSHKAVANPERA